MTIEATLQSIAVDLKRIADAIEGRSTLGTSVPGPDPEAAANNPGKAEKPTKPTKPANSSKGKKSPPAEDADEGPSLDEVRKALTALQKATDAATARAVLSDVGGATTLSKLAKDKYQDVIDEATDQLGK